MLSVVLHLLPVPPSAFAQRAGRSVVTDRPGFEQHVIDRDEKAAPTGVGAAVESVEVNEPSLFEGFVWKHEPVAAVTSGGPN